MLWSTPSVNGRKEGRGKKINILFRKKTFGSRFWSSLRWFLPKSNSKGRKHHVCSKRRALVPNELKIPSEVMSTSHISLFDY